MTEINGSDRLRFGAYEVDLHTHELWKHGTRLKLVGQPFDILAVLISRPGQLVTREELRTELWPGDTFVDFNHGLNAAVNKLRDALCDSAEDPKYIETLPRRGYRFIASVERAIPEVLPAAISIEKQPNLAPREEPIAPAASASMPDAEESPAQIAAPSVIEACATPPKKRRWLRYLISAAAVLLAALLVGHLLRSNPELEEKRAAERAGLRTAVPLTSLSDATSDPAFSPDGNRVAFRRGGFVPGVSGIWIKQVGGEELTQLTNSGSDCCPAWAPDGRSVVFSRFSDTERTIYAIPASGGSLQRLYSTSLGSKHGELDWSPDGKTIALVAEASRGTSAIFLLSPEDGKAHQITAPVASESDWGPAFSPDGSQIAFVRTSSGEFPSNIVVMPATGGEIRRLATEPAQVDGRPAWTADGESIVFAASNSRTDTLWRIPVSGGSASRVQEAGSQGWGPAISRRGFRLAYMQMSSARNIEQLDLSPAGQTARGLATSVSCENASPQISPDGKKLLFMSDRAGGMDIWVSDRDGANPIQLTAVGTAGAPRWSPDGKTVAFDVGLALDWQQPRAIFLVSADGGVPRALVQDTFNNPAPSWSRDGAWIYFPSNRSGSWQVWKVPATGGTPVQITTQGGFAAREAADHYIYYAKHRDVGPELWRIPVAGGAEAPVYPRIQLVDWAAWAVVDQGILFVESGPQGAPTLSFFTFPASMVRHLAVFQRTPFWLGATADGTSVVFDQPEDQQSHVMLLQNFR